MRRVVASDVLLGMDRPRGTARQRRITIQRRMQRARRFVRGPIYRRWVMMIAEAKRTGMHRYIPPTEAER